MFTFTVTHQNALWKSVSESINRWSMLPISTIGLISILEYWMFSGNSFFSVLSPWTPYLFFYEGETNVLSFYLEQPRLRLYLLYLPYEKGELKLPNLQWYYSTAQLSRASCWFIIEPPLSWVSIEWCTTAHIPLNSYLYSSNIKNQTNWHIIHLLKIWYI